MADGVEDETKREEDGRLVPTDEDKIVAEEAAKERL